MTKLSDTQAVILCAAAQREDRNVLPLPGSLRGGGEPRPPKGCGSACKIDPHLGVIGVQK
jgi:hypothetical protein